MQKAVIYCRVSDSKQVTKGDGLASQETRCREFAGYKSYDVVKVFKEDMSGKFASRPAMRDMLGFLRQHRKAGIVVIIDDISRLARGLEAHLKLRASLASAGGKLESPSIEFGEDSDSLLVENMLASVAQHHREKNGEHTKNRMRARMQSGYYVFNAPIGYTYEARPGNGSILVRNEPVASIIAEVLERYATGRLQTQTEAKRYLEAQPDFPKGRNGQVHQSRVQELLTRPIYAGYLTYEDWGLHLVPAKHDPLVSYETFLAVQERLKGTAYAPARKDLNQDFPLRGFVSCGHCDQPMTACWSKGRSAKYPYYLCDTKGCVEHRKSIRREKIEGEFEALLGELTPSANLFAMAFEMFRDLWQARLKSAEDEKQSMRRQLSQMERKAAQILDRLIDTDSDTLITAYEARLREMEEQKTFLTEKIAKCGQPLAPFEQVYRTAFDFLANPSKLWASERFEDKRAVLKLVFADRLPYTRNQGYRTAKTSLPFKALGDFHLGKFEMVPGGGIEPENLAMTHHCN
ncbi:recombinase family protein [Sulfitobacter mediterraneus]|nr:recombinase family protein [Sulfitobacter mediterraneus]MBM1567737.1 recombinase family protein [Sulfitobacter mediterraneus]MBM1571579.1 recombinase family protein [Sulfitobacter mediterraneus]MBM1575367.1 recombinase family protein [Sulfitobacter mediterraneus]MBM1579142.1 recombinase family protein [Sulfitobacter mediterraneus]